MNKLPSELASALASPGLRAAFGRFLGERSDAVKNSMLRVADHPTLMQLQGRALELDDLRKIITQEK